MRTLKLTRGIFVLVFFIVFLSCSTEDTAPSEEKATISVKLFDAPGDFDALNIQIEDVWLKVIDDESDPNCWYSLGSKHKGVYNILELTGGKELELVSNLKVPVTRIYEIKLVIGSENTIEMDNRVVPLIFNQVQDQRLKIQHDELLEAGGNYTFLMDFNADASVQFTNHPDHIVLSPVVRVSRESKSGTVEGRLSESIASKITLCNAGQPISTMSDADGNFTIKGIPAGTYCMEVQPDVRSGKGIVFFQEIEIIAEQTLDMGVIDL